MFGLTRQELHGLGSSDRALWRRVPRLMERPRRALMTVLITNTAVNVAIFAVSFVALERVADRPALAVAGGVGVLLSVIVFGEMVPKGVALAARLRFAPPAAGLLTAIQAAIAPLQWLLATLLVNPITRLLTPLAAAADAVTTEELRLLVEQSAREGAIDSKENEMLQAVVALGEATVREVMTPRVDLQAIGIEDEPDAAREKMRASGRRRLPVCGQDLDDIRSVVYARDLYLQPNTSIRELVRPIHFVPEQANLVQLIGHFRAEGIRFAIVVDEYGGTAGLASIHDVAKRIVGDLPEEHEPVRPAPTAERIDEDTYRLSGNLSVRLWADRFAVGEIERHVHTVAGLILAKLGRLPRPGESVRIRNLELTVEAVSNRRIESVLVKRDPNDSVGKVASP